MPNDRLEELWKDPQHWAPLGIYRCADDPRWIVPKQIPALGYTLNFAHSGAILLLPGIIVWVTAPTMLLLALGIESLYAILAAVALPTALLLFYCRRESNRRDE